MRSLDKFLASYTDLEDELNSLRYTGYSHINEADFSVLRIVNDNISYNLAIAAMCNSDYNLARLYFAQVGNSDRTGIAKYANYYYIYCTAMLGIEQDYRKFFNICDDKHGNDIELACLASAVCAFSQFKLGYNNVVITMEAERAFELFGKIKEPTVSLQQVIQNLRYISQE